MQAYGQESSSNIEEVELELAKAKLAVAKAEAELAEAKLKAIKSKDVESPEVAKTNDADIAILPDSVESEPNISTSEDRKNKERVGTGVETVLDLAKTTQAIAAVQPKIIVAETATDIAVDAGTELAKESIKDIGKAAISEIGGAAEGVAKGILSVPGSLIGGSKDKKAPEENDIQSVAITAEIEPTIPETRLDTIEDSLSEPAVDPDVNSIESPETRVDEIIPEAAGIPANVIMPGLLDLPRHENTGPMDGCASIKKGLVMGGGFMLFTCEKLLPFYKISEHAKTYQAYQKTFSDEGWKKTPSEEPGPNKTSFKRTDAYGCDIVVDVELWTDRSMNESSMNIGNRNNHRQIVFKAWFRGDACDLHYETAERMTK